MDKGLMAAPGRSRERFVALFLLGVLLFAPPLLAVFNKPARILGVPALYLYLFASWALVIALAALAVRRAATHEDLAGPAQARSAAEARGIDEEATDA